jgi:hypothetical protein
MKKKNAFNTHFILIAFLLIFVVVITLLLIVKYKNYRNGVVKYENYENLNEMYYSAIFFKSITDVILAYPNYPNTEIDIDYLNSKNKIIIFCLNQNENYNILKPFLNQIKKPFVLISGMEDTTFPTEIDPEFMEKIQENKNFKHWFAINKITPNDEKFTSIPYGLDYWTISLKPYFGEDVQTYEEQNNILQSIIDESRYFTERIPKIYANFHLNKTDGRHGNFRTKLIDIIPSDVVFYEPTFLPRSEIYKNMTKYSFVISPYGNGYDCIRTYEALCLGCIVILKRDFLSVIYDDLPVLFVNEWEDINKDLLNRTLVDFSNRSFNYGKLKMNYWIDLINSKF